MTETHFRQAFLLVLVTAISAVFVAMIRVFLLTILLAAIFAGARGVTCDWEIRTEEACLSAPEEKSAAAKEEKYHDDDEDRVGVHESLMLAEHEDWIEQ